VNEDAEMFNCGCLLEQTLQIAHQLLKSLMPCDNSTLSQINCAHAQLRMSEDAKKQRSK